MEENQIGVSDSMGLGIKLTCNCDCGNDMQRIGLKYISTYMIEGFYSCSHCKKTMTILLRMTYNDYKKGVIIE